MPQRDCHFCHATPVTREDVFRRDFQKYVLDLPATDRLTMGHGKPPEYKMIPISAIKSVVAKNVCAACNNGWMNDLDSEAERVLAPLFLDQAPVLTSEDVALLKAYAVKTAIMRGLMDNPDRFTDQQERDDLRLRRSVSPNWGVWVGRNDAPLGFFHANSAVVAEDDSLKAQQTTWLIGHLVIVVATVRGTDLDAVRKTRSALTGMIMQDGPSVIRLTGRGFEWPPIQTIDEARLPSLAQQLDMLFGLTPIVQPRPIIRQMQKGQSFVDVGKRLDSLIDRMGPAAVAHYRPPHPPAPETRE